MDQYASRLQNKIFKIENSLLDLHNEISTTIKFLIQLRENSAELVGNLNQITVPGVYLQKFMDVNSFVLKYLSFLNEVNCKFEMLEMSEKMFNKSESLNRAITEKMENRSDSDFYCELATELKLTSKTSPLKITAKQHSESDVSLNMKLSQEKLNKLENSQSQIKEFRSRNHDCNVNHNHCNNSGSNNNNNNKSVDVPDDNDANGNNKQDTGVSESGENSSSEINLKISNSVKENFLKNDTEFSNMKLNHSPIDIKSSNELNKNSSDSDISSSSESFFSTGRKKEALEKSVNVSSLTLAESINSFDSDKVHVDDNPLPAEEFSQTEDSVTEIDQNRYSFQILKNLTTNQNSEDKNFKIDELENCRENERDIKPPIIVRQLGKEYDVVVEHIKSPSEFYVSLTEQSNSSAELEKLLRSIPESKKIDWLKDKKNNKALISKEIGSYALFYSKCDEMWRRAKITNWCLEFKDNFVSIFLLDLGESKCVSIKDLLPMPEFCKNYPAVAQRCHLYGILPSGMDKNSKTLDWEKESSEKFRCLTENSNEIRIKVAPEDHYHPSSSLSVTLWMLDQDDQCINDLLVKGKFAVRDLFSDISNDSNKTKDVEPEDLNSWNPMKEDFESYQNSYDLDINDPAAFIYGYVGKDYNRICPHFAKKGFCYKGEFCKREHQRLDPLGFTTDKEEIYKDAFNSLPFPSLKSIIDVQITCILTFNQFDCILKDFKSFSDEENLQSLVQFMNKDDNIKTMKKLLIPPSAGQIVIARYSGDGFWYRARILESQPEKDFYKAVYVDYGNIEILSLSNIRAIEPEYLHLPFQAMHCFIFGIDRNAKKPLSCAIDYLNEKLSNEEISIEIVAKLPGEGINLLVHVYDQNGLNIGEDLIAKEYAISKQEMVISIDSEAMPG